MIGLTGPRGVGKTNLVLQHIKTNLNPDISLHVTTEDFYLADNKLLDLAETFAKRGGKYLFIDEIHKYSNWSKELKLIYDYHPELNVVFTGSMQGLSFREYLQLFHGIISDVYSLPDIIAHKVNVSGLKHPLPLFEKYLKEGYYLFALEETLRKGMW